MPASNIIKFPSHFPTLILIFPYQFLFIFLEDHKNHARSQVIATTATTIPIYVLRHIPWLVWEWRKHFKIIVINIEH